MEGRAGRGQWVRPSSADVVVVGDVDRTVLDTAAVIGLHVWRIERPTRALPAARALLRPAVVLVGDIEPTVLRELARIRQMRADQRLVVRPRPGADRGATTADIPGVDELLDGVMTSDEVLSRLVIHLAHARAAAPRYLPVAEETVLDVDAHALRRHGRLIRLRPMESRLLEELARSPGRALGRDWLLARVSPRVPAQGTRTIDVHVRWLRQKLERDPGRPVHLLTVRGLGYQLEPDAPPDTPVPDDPPSIPSLTGR
ncbi:MAG: winged helix-turn-helix transcriptional regulator [Chloroflexi bacterium]|nr:winged helix-turn-helix transcriptional regulator [Chloroflexota bacterium]